jgi:serine/threonine-protein kinase
MIKAGRYDLREELGRGAMGVVYHGFDPMIGRDVAVKTLRLSEAGTGLSREELVGRFQTEARAAGLLSHPNIVVVFDAGEEDGLFYITMEFVEGKSLQAVIDSRQPFPLPRVLRLMEQVCSALDFAHQHKVVHRDIKPANIMLTSDDTVKITDFGTAKILQFGTAQTAHVMGTPSYMSPEQVKGKPVDGRSDIFSLGVILYELMTGEKPFPGQNITTVIYKIINEEPIPPRSIDSSIHPGLSAVITKALAKDPDARYRSCQEFLTAIKNFHDMAAADETILMAPAGSQSAPKGNRAETRPARPAGIPAIANTRGPGATAHLPSPFAMQESPKKTGSLLLSLILMGFIGLLGYSLYPSALDLWRRSREPVETSAIPPKPEPAPQASSPDRAGAKPEAQSPEAQSNSAPQPAAPVAAAVPAPKENSAVPKQDASQPAVAPATQAKAPEPFLPRPAVIGKSVAPQKPAPPAAPSPVRLFAEKLQVELAGSPLADKVKIQATPNALAFSGSLTLAEHRELLDHLHTIPAGVRIIDDTKYSEDPKTDAAPAPVPASDPASAQVSAPASAPAAMGWIWAESIPQGARIIVDGAETGLRTPARLELKAGEHNVRLVRQGFLTVHRNVVVNPDRILQFAETLLMQ